MFPITISYIEYFPVQLTNELETVSNHYFYCLYEVMVIHGTIATLNTDTHTRIYIYI